jgi:hypothetical protein
MRPLSGCIVKRHASFGCSLTTTLFLLSIQPDTPTPTLESTALCCYASGPVLFSLSSTSLSHYPFPSFASSTKMSTRRARGHYSPLICTRCRARKIKCILPSPVTSPSTTPQTLNDACQRCRQNGFECSVGYTVLGRPGSSRIGGTNRSILRSQMPVVDGGEGGAELGSRGFLLSQPYDVSPEANRFRAEEVCEALSSPLRFLSVYLVIRHLGGT